MGVFVVSRKTQHANTLTKQNTKTKKKKNQSIRKKKGGKERKGKDDFKETLLPSLFLHSKHNKKAKRRKRGIDVILTSTFSMKK